MRDLIVLTGATAVGKTELSLEVADRLEAEIISTDSMQIYKEMDIGTAKAAQKVQEKIKHHLLDFIEPDQDYSVSEFQKDADQAIKNIKSRGKIPILVGGTHLYIKAVLEGFMLPKIEADQDLRNRLEELAEKEGNKKVHQILAEKDPKTAQKLHPNDLRRVIRAIEIFNQTGKKKSVYKKEQKLRPPRYSVYKFALIRNRENLYQRINKRVDIMMEEGLLKEVEKLISNYDLSETAKQALGYKELIAYLNQEITLDKAVDEIKKRSRNFAKRQLTWLRKEDDLIVFNLDNERKESVVNTIIEIVKGERDYERELKKRSEINF
ncbi:tRNA (adenosine(37)-N6)-dimethylallyltransferase MiaA [Halanaerobium hydrogeniformans]|uniref:tRNA dimethylallyltransferase n=1 Tax=Halanaerobium hydrogeniformans TaxID=656519 RepID=E4RKH2_HALHG|nr:tRNA (adenosine(37)-N6)-dimethylallyltransferase MiaA [Halanaerobium hydrogeniformans]ADQ14681.1 tRNA delta(2)-isopentenylpyrophosphate transferase [Halanaerobium hydrogeniformans]